jgi:hypothetical protein
MKPLNALSSLKDGNKMYRGEIINSLNNLGIMYDI